MSGRNLESYMEDAAAFSELSDDDKARLFAGDSLEGETNTDPADPALSSDPKNGDDLDGTKVEEPGATPAAGTVGSTPASEPVVLAKDGTHTIPFSELEAARERARQLEQEVLALKAVSAEPPKAAEPAAAAVPSINESLIALVKERDEALYTGDTETAHQLSMKIIGIQQEQATNAALSAMEARESQKQKQDAQDSEAAEARARAAVLIDKYPFLNPQGPATNNDAIDLVVAQRDRLIAQGVSFADAIDQAVAKVAPLFESSTTKPSPTDAEKRAAEVISKAKAQVPTSLSQVPAGSMAHHDEGEAIRSMNVNQLSRSLEGKSPEEIMKLMSRVL